MTTQEYLQWKKQLYQKEHEFWQKIYAEEHYKKLIKKDKKKKS